MYDHYSDPAVSVWQSILAQHVASPKSVKASLRPQGLAPSAPPAVVSDKLAATDRAMRTVVERPSKTVASRQALRESVSGHVIDCAARYLRLVRAEALTEFLKHYALIRHSEVPYRKWLKPGDFVLPLPDKDGKVTVGIIGDWGTGEARAQQLLASVKANAPDVVVHLGDIYYACTEPEAQAFSRHVVEVLGDIPVFTLCGNHDMYAGAGPYYRLLDRVGQPASYFCLRNASWQLLAMDTCYNDYDPAKVSTGATWVRDGSDDDAGYSELAWHVDKLANASGRRTILLSHHPLFSRISAIAGMALNQRLHKQFEEKLPAVDLWLWGHEHVQTIYGPFAGLVRGRCIGASAIPNTERDDIYEMDPSLKGQELPAFLGGDGARLRVDPKSHLYELGYAILSLDGPKADVAYYAWGETAGARVMHSERFGSDGGTQDNEST